MTAPSTQGQAAARLFRFGVGLAVTLYGGAGVAIGWGIASQWSPAIQALGALVGVLLLGAAGTFVGRTLCAEAVPRDEPSGFGPPLGCLLVPLTAIFGLVVGAAAALLWLPAVGFCVLSPAFCVIVELAVESRAKRDERQLAVSTTCEFCMHYWAGNLDRQRNSVSCAKGHRLLPDDGDPCWVDQSAGHGEPMLGRSDCPDWEGQTRRFYNHAAEHP